MSRDQVVWKKEEEAVVVVLLLDSKKPLGYLSDYYCDTISSYSSPHFTTPYPL